MWFLYAFLGAVFKAGTSYYRKKIAGNVRADIYMWFNFTVFLVALTPVILLTDVPVYTLLATNLVLLVAGGAIYILAIVFNVEALKREDLSYVAPLNAFIPVFTLLIAWLFIGESPPLVGIIGILSVFFGAYIMNLRVDKVHWYEPIQHVFKNAGARFGFGVAVAFAINTVLVKSISNNGFSALTIMYGTTLTSWLMLSYVPIRKSDKIAEAFRKHKGILIGVSLSSLLGVFFGLLALERIFSSYAISVRRLDIVISVLLGWRVLKETNIRIKLIGSIVMTAGVALLALS